MGMQMGIGKSVVGARLHCEQGIQKMAIVRNSHLVSITRCVRDGETIKSITHKTVVCESVSKAKAYMEGAANNINSGVKPDNMPMP